MDHENPYAPPQEENTYVLHADPNSVQGVYRHNAQLVLHRDSHLPPRCVKSAVAANEHLSVTFVHHSPLLYFLIFFGFPGLLAYFVIRHFASERIEIDIPLSEKQRAKRAATINYAWAVGLISGICFLGCVLWMMSSRFPSSVVFLVMVLSIILAIISASVGVAKRRILNVAKTTKTHIWFTGVDQKLLLELPSFPEN